MFAWASDGSVLVERDEPVGRLIALVVAEAFRGRGVGRALIDHVEQRARREGMYRSTSARATGATARTRSSAASASPTSRGAS
jgi:GNAT superfamily N-acetyltransferase